MAHNILEDEGSIAMDKRAEWTNVQTFGATTAGGDHRLAAALDDVAEADAAGGAATGVGRYSRSMKTTSPRVRAYELTEDLPDDVVDDVFPTGHWRDVSEGERRQRMSQEQSIDDLRQGQRLAGNR